MSTLIAINDSLMGRAQQVARQRNQTIQQVVELALQTFLNMGQPPMNEGQTFLLRRNTFRGNGVHPDLQEGDWAAVRERIYQKQGG